MSDDNEKDSKPLNDLMGALESTTSLIQTLLLDLRANSTALGSLETQVDSIQKDLDEIDSLVRGGDMPLLTKFALVAKDIENIQEQLSDLLKKLEKEEVKLDDANKKSNKIQWRIIGTVITGLLGIIASMVTYFLSQGN